MTDILLVAGAAAVGVVVGVGVFYRIFTGRWWQ